jgi:hypothetical protein
MDGPFIRLAFTSLTCLVPHPKMRLFHIAIIPCAGVFGRRIFVSDWKFAQKDVAEELALLHEFSFKKPQGSGGVCFVITVREFATPPKGQFAHFFAQADKHVNQKIAPILPTGWGNSLLEALTACVRMIREFPYEGEDAIAAKSAPGS